MHNKIISAEKLTIGQFVTVLNWKRNDNSYKGNVLEIKAINLPFIVIKNLQYNEGSIFSKPFELDTREVDLIELGKEYVQTLCPSVN